MIYFTMPMYEIELKFKYNYLMRIFESSLIPSITYNLLRIKHLLFNGILKTTIIKAFQTFIAHASVSFVL